MKTVSKKNNRANCFLDSQHVSYFIRRIHMLEYSFYRTESSIYNISSNLKLHFDSISLKRLMYKSSSFILYMLSNSTIRPHLIAVYHYQFKITVMQSGSGISYHNCSICHEIRIWIYSPNRSVPIIQEVFALAYSLCV